jgi:hypothetical protein
VTARIAFTAPGDDRGCEECLKYAYEAGGKLLRRPANDPNGAPRLRPLKQLPPCESCAKIPAGAVPHWSNAVHPSEASRRAIAHYRECRAVGWQCADAGDGLVREHAAIFRAFEDAAAQANDAVRTQLMLRLGGEARGSKGGR